MRENVYHFMLKLSPEKNYDKYFCRIKIMYVFMFKNI